MANDVVIKTVPHKNRPLLGAVLSDFWVIMLLAIVALNLLWAVTDSAPLAVAQLWIWLPALFRGLGVNIGISASAMLLGTLLGLVVGGLSLAPSRPLRAATHLWVQAFRNAPVLVLIYFTTYVFPFEIVFLHRYIPFPDWIKVVIGLGLPASAIIAEIFRGAVQSIPSTQWETAQSMAFRRSQIFRYIILPQCVRRMLPPWMNVYASITMSTSLASLVGVHDVVDMATIASNTVSRIDFTILVYFTLLLLFFFYCYPISRITRRLEKRLNRH
ncbi:MULTISPECIES: amino acid ABC transporter permease [Brenneria]|uniref:Amino acid ABC transporter permease n=1 Tax=Brenneria nigrifluens DSM 30175 = ATCC 13028 TaxID=1121120 RepID=A0A2U1UM26_9GAMM|nr:MULTISPECIES: amino acid ABC transporter permease [Brenneria]EHD23819.1 polar amino acid ABC transporter, inner membrane subunit [Brenneria sp. EniD312]PWC22677.1 amino acid ABC transporter permease [Brenneria nigrifluens DSM 30175 = ATCC 13028]QCR06729.1 amino acid ABC transporter permease [Brenneria nigrifluens DSM 30175 = ATCC 13028]